jgi:hypothetical protein
MRLTPGNEVIFAPGFDKLSYPMGVGSTSLGVKTAAA